MSSTVGTSDASPGTASAAAAGGSVRPHSGDIDINLKFFARARDLAGCGEVAWTLSRNSTVAELRLRLAAVYPALNAIAAHLFVAIDGDYAADDFVIKSGDEVAVFPPVSGG